MRAYGWNGLELFLLIFFAAVVGFVTGFCLNWAMV